MNDVFKDKIKEIAAFFKDYIENGVYENNIDNFGLLSGSCGISLFLNVYSQVSRDSTLNDLSMKYLDITMEQISNDKTALPYYCSGITGVIHAVFNSGMYQLTDFEITKDIYRYIKVMTEFNIDNFDFLHGVTGIIYALLSSRQSLFFPMINSFIDKLWEKKEYNGIGYRWKFTKGIDNKYNISLSHGMSAIVMVLICIYSHKCYNNKKIKLLIENAVAYILSQEIDVKKYGSFFPYDSIEKLEKIRGSRMAWCYGDLGVGITLFRSGMIMNRQDWIDKALDVLLFAANNRRDLESNLVVDACLCHGTAGIGQIFYRMWWNTRIPDFKDASDYWFNETLNMSKFEDGLAGFKFFSVGYGFIPNYSLLEGIAGIGLALTTYSYNIEPVWDECLLLS